MRDHSKHIQLSRDEAIAEMLDRLRAGAFAEVGPASCERVALGDSFGRVLAEDIYAKTDIPNVLTCCMDSVALHWDDFADLDEDEMVRFLSGRGDCPYWRPGDEYRTARRQ